MTTCGLLLGLAVVLAVTVSMWALVAVPLLLVAAYGAWIGLSVDETWDALDGWNDPGSGPAGIAP